MTQASTDILIPDTALAVVETTIAKARQLGASACECAASMGEGLSVTARNGDVETIEHNRDKGLVVTIFLGQCQGSASTSDFSAESIEQTIEAAKRIAQRTEPDEYAGLVAPEYLAQNLIELDLDHPWDLSAEEAVTKAIACEAAALTTTSAVKQSDGATVSRFRGVKAYGNSHGFTGTSAGTRHGVSCVMVGESGGNMQRGYWYTVARNASALEPDDSVGRQAAKRTEAKLNARKLTTREVPVLFEAPVAGGLLGHFIGAISGGNLYRKASFLLDALDTKIFPEHITINESPHLIGALGSAAFDDDGVQTRDRTLVDAGFLRSYVLNGYAARRLKMTPTGNAGGVHNLSISHSDKSFDDLIKEMGRGVVVTDLMGFGVNTLTGDYSRGASGFWVENGEIQYPVEEITIASKLQNIFMDIALVGNDLDLRGNVRCGSILINSMTVAGG